MNGTTIRCDDCGEQIRLERKPNRTLQAACECGAVGTRVADVLPGAWS